MLSEKSQTPTESKIYDPFVGNLRKKQNQSVMKELRKWEGKMRKR